MIDDDDECLIIPPQILREVQLQKNLKHRHVVEFQSYFEDDSNVYIILENCSRKVRHTHTLPCVRINNRQVQNTIFQERGKTFSFSYFFVPDRRNKCHVIKEAPAMYGV